MYAVLGILFHAIGGFAAGSFYIPFNFIKKWSWESSWMVLGIGAWVFAPITMAYFTVPDLMTVLASAKSTVVIYTFLFGILWGIGGLTFGLAMRYLGISLGMAVALGFCAAFGTLIPPIYNGTFNTLLNTLSGFIMLSGVIVCLIGIGVCGKAGMLKEKDLDVNQQKETVAEFNLVKRLFVSGISGILSADFTFKVLLHNKVLQLIKLLGINAVDFGIFEDRSHHYPSLIARGGAKGHLQTTVEENEIDLKALI